MNDINHEIYDRLFWLRLNRPFVGLCSSRGELGIEPKVIHKVTEVFMSPRILRLPLC